MAKGNDPNPQWSNVDWSKFDLSSLGRARTDSNKGGRPPSRLSMVIFAVVGAFFLIPLVFAPLVGFLTDLLWFRSLGLEEVFLRRYSAGFWTFLLFFAAFFLLAVPNLYFALRPRMVRVVVDAAKPRPRPLRTTLRLLPLLLIPSFFFGLIGGGLWDPLLRWLNAAPFGVSDPMFGLDVGFYFFTLPVLEFVRGWLFAALVLIALGVLAIYVLRGVISIATAPLARADIAVSARTALALAKPARAHLSILGGFLLLLVAAGYALDRYDLLFRQEGVLTGAGYASANARLLALTILSGIVAIAAVACFANAIMRTLWVIGAAIGVWLIAAVLVGGIYPSLVETFIVKPDQLNRERIYIERNIEATRAAYGLANAEESLVDIPNRPTAEVARAELADVDSIRLWDYRPLLDAYQQLQALRQYYTFNDVDVDRYSLDGTETPSMISAREMDVTKLPVAARTWLNEHLFYTHGFGAVSTPMGGVTSEGLPDLSLRDIPPQGNPRIEQPRIYYGELTNQYAVVGTTQDEFDYPQERDVTTRFSGSGGVGIGGLWDRLLFAIRFGDLNLLISQQIQADSRILFNRQIAERVRAVAPFLAFDNDPYLVVAEGRLYWMQDAYTTGSRYPYSHRLEPAQRGDARVGSELNYIRNSVKVVTDAYDGSMTFYVVDEQDPVLKTLSAIYPTLFTKTVADMPQAIRQHLRYPEDLFRIQVEVFATYHMTNPDEFYNRGDAWRIANEIFAQGGSKQPIEPYYVTARLPGSDRREFILFVPMTPAGEDRDNMVAWIAGRADPPEYGNLRVLRFPKDRTIFGPLQIEARIEADATIRQQLTLLSSGPGATLTRGNLVVLPVGDSFIYIEPLFVQATQGRIPELKRVILATQDRVVMDETFEKALDRLFVPGAPTAPPITTPPPGTTPPPTGTPGPSPSPGAPAEIAQLIRDASGQYQRAQDALRAGDFATYGVEIRALEATLAQLRAATE